MNTYKVKAYVKHKNQLRIISDIIKGNSLLHAEKIFKDMYVIESIISISLINNN